MNNRLRTLFFISSICAFSACLQADLHEAEMEFRNYNYNNNDPSIPPNGVNNHPSFYNNSPSTNQNNQYQVNPYQGNQGYNPQQNPNYPNYNPNAQLYPQGGNPNQQQVNPNQDPNNLNLQIQELHRENQYLEQQNAAIQAQQKHIQDAHNRRVQIQAQWEQDHERE